VAPVYAAGEAPIEGVSAHSLAKGLMEHGHRSVRTLSALEDLPGTLRDVLLPGDLVVCLGAGDITTHAQSLARSLAAGP
jgi:UDP-N-acetylmuramate--alanine ligase